MVKGNVLTEGPWRLHANGESNWILTGGDYPDEPDLYAEITTSNPADARAMAAATKLLAACERAAEVLDDLFESLEILDELHAVIAEVKGGAK